MAKTLDLGRRLELQSSDKHCGDISLALYRRNVEGVPHFLVHTYSSLEGAAERVAYIRRALIVMLGLAESDHASGWLYFPCKTIHQRALKRAFLDLTKLETHAPLQPKPLTAFDKKADGELSVVGLGDGVYQIKPQEGSEKGLKRAQAVARGYVKLCEMDSVADGDNRVAFPCKTPHDALMGMLMFRAQNVRFSMQEEEMAAARGVLSAPSQQK